MTGKERGVEFFDLFDLFGNRTYIYNVYNTYCITSGMPRYLHCEPISPPPFPFASSFLLTANVVLLFLLPLLPLHPLPR